MPGDRLNKLRWDSFVNSSLFQSLGVFVLVCSFLVVSVHLLLGQNFHPCTCFLYFLCRTIWKPYTMQAYFESLSLKKIEKKKIGEHHSRRRVQVSGGSICFGRREGREKKEQWPGCRGALPLPHCHAALKSGIAYIWNPRNCFNIPLG